MNIGEPILLSFTSQAKDKRHKIKSNKIKAHLTKVKQSQKLK
jgi:hypothetical protein